MKETKPLDIQLIAALIHNWKLNKDRLASKMGMSPGAFKNKLNTKQTAYSFTPEQLEKLKAVLQDLEKEIKQSTRK